MIRHLRGNGNARLYLAKKDRQTITAVYKKELAKRSLVFRIVAAWLITVPASGLMAADFYYTIRGYMMPRGLFPDFGPCASGTFWHKLLAHGRYPKS